MGITFFEGKAIEKTEITYNDSNSCNHPVCRPFTTLKNGTKESIIIHSHITWGEKLNLTRSSLTKNVSSENHIFTLHP